MARNYAQVMKEIDALSREAESLKRKEVEGVIARIREAIAVYGLTAADLGLARGTLGAKSPAKDKRTAKRSKSKISTVAKFKDSDGNIWVGRGPRPLWLRKALQAGRRLEDFAV